VTKEYWTGRPGNSGEDGGAARPRGRPRDEAAHDRILAATVAILETEGLAGLSMQAVARRAGVSKQTVYTWWPSRGVLTLDALTRYATAAIPGAEPDDGSPRQRLLTFLQQTFRALTPSTRSTLRALIAEAQIDPAVAQQFWDRLVAVRRTALKATLLPALPEGATEADADYAADLIYGVMWYRLLVGHAPIDDTLAEQLVATVSAGRLD
jgi:AcrR family transcriptional regulator